MQFICETCTQEFEANGKGRRYCSRECYLSEHTSRTVSIECEICGESFQDSKPRRFCSNACYLEHHRSETVEDKCPECGTLFTSYLSRRKKYCSGVCWSVFRKKQRTVNCKTCGKTFERGEVSNKYCSHECYTADHTGTNHSRFNGYVTSDKRYMKFTRCHPEHPGEWVHRVVWKEHNPGEQSCACGRPAQQVHHIDGDGFNNDPSNLQGICKSCHTRHHMRIRWAR